MKELGPKLAFAHRIGPWVVWNVTDWSPRGWIAIVATPARSETGKSRPGFRLSWNGTRFADGSELKRFSSFSDAAGLATELMKILPRTTP